MIVQLLAGSLPLPSEVMTSLPSLPTCSVTTPLPAWLYVPGLAWPSRPVIRLALPARSTWSVNLPWPRSMLLTSPLQPPLQVKVNGEPPVPPRLPELALGVLLSFGRESCRSRSEPVTPSCTLPLPLSHQKPSPPLPSLASPQPTF